MKLGVPEPEAQKIVHQVVDLLKQQREALGWSQRALAARAGLDPKTVNLIERKDRSPTLFTLALLSEAMGIQLSKLLEQSESATGKQS